MRSIGSTPRCSTPSRPPVTRASARRAATGREDGLEPTRKRARSPEPPAPKRAVKRARGSSELAARLLSSTPSLKLQSLARELVDSVRSALVGLGPEDDL